MTPWNLPLETLPRITLAGQIALAERDFTVVHQGPAHALHLHDYAGTMLLGEEAVTLAPGDVTLSPAGLATRYHLPRPGRHWCIHFTCEEGAGARVPLALHLSGGGHLREGFAEVGWLFSTASDAIGAAAARLAAQSLLLAAARLGAPLPADDAAARAAQFIDHHFMEPIGVHQIAAAAGRSPAHMARLFRQRFGTTMLHRLMRRRADHARFLLQSTDLAIGRIAAICGIPDPQAFNKVMRAVHGCSPSALRRAGQPWPRVATIA
ncbi:MAG: helix-turn-helix transcriptional regulator [Erythrobacter sp.]|jgi:AraC-like DNA-binding protein